MTFQWFWLIPLEDSHPDAPSFGSPCHGSERTDGELFRISTSRYFVEAQIMYVDARSNKVKRRFIMISLRSGLGIIRCCKK